MIRAARGIINPLVSDVHIFTDHRTGPPAGKYDLFLLVDVLVFSFDFLNGYLVEAKKIILHKAIIPFYLTGCLPAQLSRIWNFTSCRDDYWLLHLYRHCRFSW